jgi:hypothetical protein
MEKELTSLERKELLEKLKTRFENNMNRHPGLEWKGVRARLEAHEGRMWSLNEMEKSGGEPDVIARDGATGEYIFCDCAAESPAGRRSLCYDSEALRSRKENKPENSVMEMAAAMGIELLTEEQYRNLQRLGRFDARTSSWIMTPPVIRKLGGALFADFRYSQVFVYHNGASSYYSSRGFRGTFRV